MVRRRQQLICPNYDQLEAIRLLSSVVAMVNSAVPGLSQQSRAASIKTIEGTYLITQANPDFGHTTRLEGTANIGSLGAVPFTGNLNGTGFVARGRAGGTITFAGQNGALVVTLTGPAQTGFAGLPSQFKYQVTRATGGLKGMTGAGTAKLVFGDSSSFSILLGPGISRK